MAGSSQAQQRNSGRVELGALLVLQTQLLIFRFQMAENPDSEPLAVPSSAGTIAFEQLLALPSPESHAEQLPLGNRLLFFPATREGPICCSPECRDVGGRRLGLPGCGQGGWAGKAPLAFGVSPRAGSAFQVHPALFMEEESFSGREGGRTGKLFVLEQATCRSWAFGRQAGGLIPSPNHGRSPLGRSQPGKLQEASKRRLEGRRAESPTPENPALPFALRWSSSTSAHTQGPLKPGEGPEPPPPMGAPHGLPETLSVQKPRGLHSSPPRSPSELWP